MLKEYCVTEDGWPEKGRWVGVIDMTKGLGVEFTAKLEETTHDDPGDRKTFWRLPDGRKRGPGFPSPSREDIYYTYLGESPR